MMKNKKQRRKRYRIQGLFRNSSSIDRKYNEMISRGKCKLADKILEESQAAAVWQGVEQHLVDVISKQNVSSLKPS